MNREKKRQQLLQTIAKSEKTIAECELKIMDIEDEELFEQYSLEFENEEYISKPTKMGNIIEIDGGIQLSASACKDYTNVTYEGDGIIKVGRRTCSLTAPEILVVLSDYDNIPKIGIDTRKKWVSKKIGKPKRIDTILWNYIKGNLNEALTQYKNENPLYYNQGQLAF